MAASIHVHLLPSLVQPEQLRGGVVVVVDVLRATTTIAHALAAGAVEVLPCGEVDEARRLAERSSEITVLGGERRGVKIEGFDLGNSPSEYSPAIVGGKTVVFTTTNGTRAMLRCRQAKRVLTGAFVNASSIASELETEDAVHLLCAGTCGEISREDVLLAGMLTVDLSSRRDDSHTLNDSAQVAADSWRQASEEILEGIPLAGILADSLGGSHLQRIGLTRDIEAASRIDAIDLVPELNVLNWHIRPA
jgi:2-phosphosulfolactate phosphatase